MKRIFQSRILLLQPTNVVGLIEHNNCLLCEVSRNHFCNLRIEHIGIVEYYHISLLQLNVRERERKRERRGSVV